MRAAYSIGDVLCQNEEYWLVVSVEDVYDLDFDTDEAKTKKQYTLLRIFNYTSYVIKLFAWDLSETEYIANVKTISNEEFDHDRLRKIFEENVFGTS